MNANWITDPKYPNIEHQDGTPWDEARIPWRLHRCRPQTRGSYDRWCDYYDRCACGGKRAITPMLVHGWTGKNSRRAHTPLVSGSSRRIPPSSDRI